MNSSNGHHLRFLLNMLVSHHTSSPPRNCCCEMYHGIRNDEVYTELYETPVRPRVLRDHQGIGKNIEMKCQAKLDGYEKINTA